MVGIPHFIKFFGGPLDGIKFEVPMTIEKIVVQLANNNILRYEHDQIDDFGTHTEGRMVVTWHPDDFDEEMKHDEAKGIQ